MEKAVAHLGRAASALKYRWKLPHGLSNAAGPFDGTSAMVITEYQAKKEMEREKKKRGKREKRQRERKNSESDKAQSGSHPTLDP